MEGNRCANGIESWGSCDGCGQGLERLMMSVGIEASFEIHVPGNSGSGVRKRRDLAEGRCGNSQSLACAMKGR